MMFMHDAMQQALNAGNAIDWKTIQDAATRSLPPCAPYISTLAGYVQSNAGGVSGELLHELSTHQKTFQCKNGKTARAMGSEFMAAWGRLNFGSGQKLPYLQNACIKANMVAPKEKIVDGFCKLITPSNVSSLTSKAIKDSAFQAEHIMHSARNLAKMQVDETTIAKLFGQLDVRCILHILKKGKDGPENKVFKSLADIAEVVPSRAAAHMC